MSRERRDQYFARSSTRHRLIDVQFPAVAFDLLVAGELQHQVAEGLVSLLAVRAARVDTHELLVAKLMRFVLLALKQQHLNKLIIGGGVSANSALRASQ